MRNNTSIKSTKVAKKAAAKRVAAKAAKPRKTAPKSQSHKVARPALLAGGHPQIAKADGDAPVQAYIAAMPGGHAGLETGRRAPPRRPRRAHRPRCAQGSQMELAVLPSRGPGLVPQLPLLHGVRGSGFLPRHVAASCPPGESKHKDVRYLDIHEDDQLDEAQLAAWVKQASQLPGERM